MVGRGLRFAAFFVASALVPLLPAGEAAANGASAAGAAVAEMPDHIGSAACAACHDEQATAWAGSHHALAWTEPGPDTVLGDFDGATFSHLGATTTFSREGDTFYIESAGPDGQVTRWPVAGVIGTSPLQQYFVETEPGRFQSFDVAWNTLEDCWYKLSPDENVIAGDGMHWTGPYKTWNARCAECHGTDFSRNYDAATKDYASTVGEIGVGCEACHGPGAAHAAWAEAANDGAGAAVIAEGLTPLGLTVAFPPDAPETELQQCAGCHSSRTPLLGGSPVPGTPFHDAFGLTTLRAPQYFADGQAKGDVHVYGSFLQSAMYTEGVTCSDCHDSHSGQLRAEGNAICTSCHSEDGSTEFPNLRRANYEDAAHHFHAAGSDAAQCVSCHMTERLQLGIDTQKDHSFRVPRPDLTVATGAPNACTGCHAAEGPYWAQEELERRFPDSVYRGDRYAATFFAVQQGATDAAENLVAIAQARSLPGIVRATALEMLAPVATAEIAGRVADLLDDADPLVRTQAIAVQRAAEPGDMAERLRPRLEDDARVVRIAAAREMLAVPPGELADGGAKALSAALAEWQATLDETADYPETQLVLGGIALTTRDLPGALAAFKEAVRMDPQLLQAWSMLVRLQAASGDEDGARETLSEALTRLPDDPVLLALADQLP